MQLTNARRREIQRERTAESAAADDQHPRRCEALLHLDGKIRQQQLAAEALELGIAQHVATFRPGRRGAVA